MSDETDPDGMPPLVWKPKIAHDEEAEVQEVYQQKAYQNQVFHLFCRIFQ